MRRNPHPPRRESIVIGGIATTLGSLFIVFLGFVLSQLCFFVLRPDCMTPQNIAKAPAGTATTAPEKLLIVTNSSASVATTTVATTSDKEPLAEGVLLGARLSELQEEETETIEQPEFPATANFPPQCDSGIYRVLKKQLPAEGCNGKKPWSFSNCAFSNKTVCGNARPHWFFDFVHQSLSSSTTDDTFRAIVVGCNKGYEAVNLLRMFSHSSDNTYDLSQWENQFLTTDDHEEIDESIECRVDGSAVARNASKTNARVYCIEGYPKTADQLEKTKKALGYGDELQLSNFVVGTMSFDEGSLVWMGDDIGAMGTGDFHWTRKCAKDPEMCRAVPAISMDDFISSRELLKATATDAKTGLNTLPLIDFMSITAEGSDYEILKGAAKDLGRIQYIDFGYHWNTNWGKKASNFTDLIYRLKKKGFVCYFPGSDGQDMWRVTDCWQDHYEHKYKASVGCVNANIPRTKPLLARMERMFLETLQKGTS